MLGACLLCPITLADHPVPHHPMPDCLLLARRLNTAAEAIVELEGQTPRVVAWTPVRHVQTTAWHVQAHRPFTAFSRGQMCIGCSLASFSTSLGQLASTSAG